MAERPICQLCGEPMPEGEEMFYYHGFSGPCPKPPMKTKKEVIEKIPDYFYADSTFCMIEGTYEERKVQKTRGTNVAYWDLNVNGIRTKARGTLHDIAGSRIPLFKFDRKDYLEAHMNNVNNPTHRTFEDTSPDAVAKRRMQNAARFKSRKKRY